MSKLTVFKFSVMAVVMLLVTQIAVAQNNYSETFTVSDDVLVSVNTSHTNVIFETWNKDKVEVEAFIDNDALSEEEKKELFDTWNFEVLGNSQKVIVTSNSRGMQNNNMELFTNIRVMPDMEFIGPLMDEMVTPIISNLQIPELPEDLLRDMGAVEFDYEAFKKDKEGYMKEFEAQMDKKLGKDFAKKMEAWGEEFAKEWNDKNSERISAEWEEKMEAWGEKFEANMANWAKEMEKQGGNYSKQVITGPNGKTIIIQGDSNSKLFDGKANKTIIIRMPKNSKTEINVRHGEIKMADVSNVKATLNYSPFTAKSIDGGETLINASYAPVIVEDWKYGTLYLKFVENCNVGNVERINLRANTSDVVIGTIRKEATLIGSLGNFRIKDIANGFTSINITLKNNDAIIEVPNTSFSFFFDGKKSTLKYPTSLELSTSKKGDHVFVQGFNGSKNTNSRISLEALYSNVRVE